MKITENNETIDTVAYWQLHAAPKMADKQWKKGRSAYECAYAWCDNQTGPAVPAELFPLLNSHPGIKNLRD
jgi:hypothetical protein